MTTNTFNPGIGKMSKYQGHCSCCHSWQLTFFWQRRFKLQVQFFTRYLCIILLTY